MDRLGFVAPSPGDTADHGGDPVWLITLADLISLMLVFFVMLFAMSSLDRRDLKAISGSALIEPVVPTAPARVQAGLPLPDTAEGRDPEYLASVIRAKFEAEPLLSDLAVTDLGDRAVIFVPLDRLKEKDIDAATRPGGLFHALAGALRTLPNRIVVDSRLGGAGAKADPGLWRAALVVGYRASRALEAAGLALPVGARAMVRAQAGPSGLDIVIFAAGRTDLESAGP